ncbi:hypothetical protein LEP1GSC161_1781 [Leptospira santarosai str. CBC1416]|uniref:Uncharacterized protein n=3 Tax=Leptospira santarosai TaxID=28183 RepID=M6UJW5_9LEPT|nr:hypothetical protein LEP1GSC068_2296 [Leptospira sp. Fiocruz LV3954]EKR91848.1 hypothetical protein LEP1GSC163_3642 [Leptospira santarosai str. CBC379]EMI66584.1 hypothetical protein LEP1GSC076_0324 [Leptospira sp. Fiocruz LV4135]EMJ49274.1 hypothetical protein LEP1GSC169_1230 [Leptospira santarosai str. HAI1349]EMM75902.1 hypothetical protein LEP1GSC040_2918 [Leptospira santarosai str. 2000030832]EMM85573.1 hypothetical protein LEP1GSC039_1750 [Leptospira santarosai str. 2000027870]EMN227
MSFYTFRSVTFGISYRSRFILFFFKNASEINCFFYKNPDFSENLVHS